MRAQKTKTVKLITTSAMIVSLLAGCNPPMPPEALAALAEASFTCIDGSVETSFSEEVSDGAQFLADNLTLNCPGMTMMLAPESEGQVLATSSKPASVAASGYAAVPYAVESGVFVITSSAGAAAAFSPDTIQGILDGSITDWSDPKVAADNGGVSPLAGPITLITKAQAEAVDALKVWFEYYANKPLVESFDTRSKVSLTDYQNLPEGSIAFMPGAVFTQLSNIAMVTPMPASLLVDTEKFPTGATPDMMSIQSAASQWKVTKSEKSVKVAINFDAKALPPAGFDEAPAPYQIIYPVNLYLVGEDNLAARAVARYLLRQDSQGSLTLVAGLPVAVRAESLAFVSKGLPTPLNTEPTN